MFSHSADRLNACAITSRIHEMEEEEFHAEADTLLESLHEMMDTLVEEDDIPDSDVEFGVSCTAFVVFRTLYLALVV